jgi:ABC-2 type transport system permease protein
MHPWRKYFWNITKIKMLTIIQKTIKDKYKTLLIYIVANLAMLMMYVAIYPLITKQMDSLLQVLDSMPQELLKAFGSDGASMTTLEGILSGKQFNMLWPIITVVFTTNFAAYSIAQEVDKKTFSILLAQPISRAKIYWGKYLTGFLFSLLYVVLTVPITILVVKLFNVSINEVNVLKFSLEATFFTFAFYSVAFMISAIAKDTGPVYFICIGMVIGMYFLQVMSILLTQLEPLKYFSAFYYSDSARSLVKGILMPEGILVFSVIGVVSALIGAFAFNKRDITT